MKKLIEEYFKSHKKEMLDCIAELVAVPSVRGEATEGKPFGEKPYEALELALNIAEKYGFITENHDGYVGTVDFKNENPRLGILAHLDVVPAGDGWNTDPFNMLVDEDRVIGRGVSDDKGPAVCALFAMKAIKDLNIPITKNCRLILGTDEECGSSDIAHYFKTEKYPEYTFTPDANFPVTNGEKGRFAKRFYGEFNAFDEGKKIVSLKGGVAANAVPSFAEAELCGVEKTELERAIRRSAVTNAKYEIDGNRVICIGTSAHASLPEMGNNPITALIEMLSNIELDSQSKKLVSSLKNMFPHGKYNGEDFGVSMSDMLGELTLSLNIVDFNGKAFEGCFDTRTPMCATRENCAEKINSIMNENGFTLENTDMIEPHYVDEKSEFVSSLLSAYELFSEEKGECISMGGGTYVHDIPSGVAFGAISRDTQTNMHGADEFMLIEDLLTAAEIYTCVIADVCK